MELNEYQLAAMETCLPSCRNVSYMILNLTAEVGEFADKIAKSIRNGNAHIEENDLIVEYGAHPELRNGLKGELGDILWQLSGLCTLMSWSLDEIAQANLDKLKSRQQRGVIDGKGDNR